jgi:hypothetical protein
MDSHWRPQQDGSLSSSLHAEVKREVKLPTAGMPAWAAAAASSGGGWAGVRTALGALLEAVEQQAVELHAQAAASSTEIRTALLAVADAVRTAHAGSGGCGRGGGRGGLMNGRTVARAFLGLRSGRNGLKPEVLEMST